MGCINSTHKITDLRDDVTANGNANSNGNGMPSNAANGTLSMSNGSGNSHGSMTTHDIAANSMYRVRAVRLQPDMPMCRNGYLELTPREIVFLPQGSSSSSSAGTHNVPVIWSLQHLRRYGANGETFSFEAGRRCMSGPGIFTFRLAEADSLYQLFQRYINDVTTLTDDMFQFQGPNIDQPSSYSLARSHAHTNNYLEPTTAQRNAAARSDYFGGSSPISMDLDSPDSLPSLSFGANEVVHFSHNSRYAQQLPGNVEPLTLQTTGNIYSERPMAVSQYQQHREHHNNNNNNNNTNNYTNRSEFSIYGRNGVESTTSSAFSTMSRKLMVRRSSMDVPPKECAPLLMTPTTPTLRLYANIEQWADGQISMHAESCYENINRNDIPGAYNSHETPMKTSMINNSSNPTTPGASGVGHVATISRMASIADPESMSLGSGGDQSLMTSGMNYIVLDLDHPRSPAATGPGTQYSPKTPFDSEFSIPMVEQCSENSRVMQHEMPLDKSPQKMIPRTTTTLSMSTTTTTANITSGSSSIAGVTALSTNTNTSTTKATITASAIVTTDILNEQLDYSTIDFVKTGALVNESSTNGTDFDMNTDDDLAEEEEESRITRHSKCVRKAYSISE